MFHKTFKISTVILVLMIFSPVNYARDILVSAHDRTIEVWEISPQIWRGRLYMKSRWVKDLKGHASTVLSMVFSKDGKYLASGAMDRTVRIWDTSDENPGNWQLVQTLQMGEESLKASVAFNSTGTFLASFDGKTVKFWDTSSWREVAALKDKDYESRSPSVAFSPDGTKLAFGSDDGSVKILDISSSNPQDWQEVKALPLTGYYEIISVAFSPDGTKLASGSDGDLDSLVKIWDTSSSDPEDWKEVTTLKGHKSEITSLAFSPDGTKLASGSSDSNDISVKIWDTSDWKLIKTLKTPDPVFSVTFNNTGKKLAFGTRGGAKILNLSASLSRRWHLIHEGWYTMAEFPKKSLVQPFSEIYAVAFQPKDLETKRRLLEEEKERIRFMQLLRQKQREATGETRIRTQKPEDIVIPRFLLK